MGIPIIPGYIEPWADAGPAEQFGMNWPGWRVELIGIYSPFTAEQAAAGPPWHSITLTTQDGEFLTCIQLWRQRAWRESSGIIAEKVWNPELGDSKRLVLLNDYDPAQLEDAHRGFDLLAQTVLKPQRGRPDIYTDANEVEFFEELDKAAHEAVQQGDRVSFSSLNRHGGPSRATFTKYVTKFGYDLALIEAEAMRCTKQRHNCAFLVRDRARFKKNRG